MIRKVSIFLRNKKNVYLSLAIIVALILSGSFYIIFISGETDQNENIEKSSEEIVIYPKENKEKEVLELNVSAAYSLYYDENNETVLYNKNENDPLPIASISKLMTALVVLENYNTEDRVGINEYDIISRTEFRDFRAWNQTKIIDMINQMLVESNNSGAFAMALISNNFIDKEGESVDIFVSEMNRKANNIGLKDTKFINPSGLDGREKYNQSTAKEVALLSKYILENEREIFDITLKPSYRLYSPDKLIYYEAINTNQFLHTQKKEWSDLIIGGKTGWTHLADGCLIIVLEAPNGSGYIINVVLGAGDRFKEMEKLVEYVYETYQF